jgi:hypothetical protein
MKRNLKQILLVFLTLAFAVSASTCLFSCGREAVANTTGDVIPGIMASDSSTSGTVDATGGTTTGNVQPPQDVTTGTTTTIVTPPEDSGAYINPLTGLKTNNKDASTLKPLAVVVDNIDVAYAHQTGLTQADILYETLVAPGITRFTALISDYSTLKNICNIREAYMEHIDIVGSHNAVLVAHGGASHLGDFVSVAAARFGGGWNESLQKNTYGYINTFKDIAFTAEGGERYGTIKYYKDDETYRKDIGFDTLLTSSAVAAIFGSKASAFAQSGATEKGTAQAFAFVDLTETKVMNGTAANEIKISFTMDNYSGTKSVTYAYDAELKMYLRYQGTSKKAHKDSVTGEQLAFTNVLTLFTDVTSSVTSSDAVVTSTAVVGEGTGYYFYGGEAVEIKWSKSAWDGALTLTDKDGNAFEIARGTTYVAYLDNTNTAKAVSFN